MLQLESGVLLKLDIKASFKPKSGILRVFTAGYARFDLPFDYFVCGFESVTSNPVITKAGTYSFDF